MDFETFLYLWGAWDIGSLGWNIPKLGLLIYLCLQVFIILAYFIIIRIIRKREIKFHKISPDLVNGLRFLVRIAITIISVIIFVVFLNVDADSLLLLLGIFTTAIMFASIKTVNNFIAGVWITFTQPFTVGDYIKIKNVEGIVTEISSNYTKIKHKTNNITQIPNLECLKSKITNYTVDIDYYKSQIERLETLSDQYPPLDGDIPNRVLADIKSEIEEINQVRTEFQMIQDLFIARKNQDNQELSKYVQKNKLVRYTFAISLKKEPENNVKKLDAVCKKYREKFRITPDWKVVGLRYKIDYMFVIITPDPEDIIEFYDDFLWDVYSILN